APGEGGAVLPPADTTLASFRAALDDDFNTAAAVGHLYESFVLANKLLDDPKAAAKDVRRRTLARLRRDLPACGGTRPPAAPPAPRSGARRRRAGILPARVACFSVAPPHPSVPPPRHRPRR